MRRGKRVSVGKKKNSGPGATVIGGDSTDSETGWPHDLRQVISLSPDLSFLVYKWKRKIELDKFQGFFFPPETNIKWCLYTNSETLINVLTFKIVLFLNCAPFS